MMKQPRVKLRDEYLDQQNADWPGVYVDVKSSEGDFACLGIGKTKKAAYKVAARRLRKMADEAERLSR